MRTFQFARCVPAYVGQGSRKSAVFALESSSIESDHVEVLLLHSDHLRPFKLPHTNPEDNVLELFLEFTQLVETTLTHLDPLTFPPTFHPVFDQQQYLKPSPWSFVSLNIHWNDDGQPNLAFLFGCILRSFLLPIQCGGFSSARGPAIGTASLGTELSSRSDTLPKVD